MDFTTTSAAAFILYYYWKSQYVAGPGLKKCLFCATLGLALTPIFLLCLVIVLICRTVAHIWLSLTDSRYNGLLNIIEVFYEREPEGAHSIINILGSVLSKSPNSTGEDFMKRIQERAQETVQNDKRAKILCIVKDWLGFRYWKLVGIDFERQIRMFNVSNTTELRDYLSDIACQPIHGNRIWEFLVGDTQIDGKYPFILRVHHNYGHAPDIRDFFFSWLATNSTSKPKKPRSKKTLLERYYSIAQSIGTMISSVFHILLFAPTQTISQYLEPQDRHSLKADKLTTQKYLRWVKGDINKVMAIRENTNLTSTEVLLMAFSKTLDDLFKKRGERVDSIRLFTPLNVSGQIIPVIIKLPVATERRKEDVIETCRRTRERPPYFMHSLLPRYFTLLLPCAIPSWAYESTQFSAVLSNFPGVPEKPEMEHFVIDTVFSFPPSVLDKNGVGMIVSLAAGQYFFALNIDKSLVKNESEPQFIVDGMVKFIDELYESSKINN